MIKRFAVILMAITIATAAFAASEKSNRPVGTPTGGGSAIEWVVSVSGHDSINLTVVGPSGDVVMTKKFNAGKNPQVRLQDLGARPEDGVYNVEMVVTPRIPGSVAAALAAARQSGDDVAARKVLKDAGIAANVSQSESFMVLNGSIVTPNQEESAAQNASSTRNVTTDSASASSRFKPQTDDQVIPDDLIVQQSLCVGFDCVDGESFGFDTIRLKENSTRIKFDDTSTSAGYPANDWQLTANDSASGGANKFSIEDITGSKVPVTVTAGASTNSIFVDSTGRVGFRTSTPVLDLHVATSNTPAIRLEQNSSGGFTAQTWDIGANEANFFVRDVTGGSRLPFRIRPGAPTSSVDISASGNVGIGTASPDVLLNVEGTGSQFLTVADNAATPHFTWIYNGGASDNSAIGWDTASAMRFGTSTSTAGAAFSEKMRITTGGSVGIGTNSPSSRLTVNGGDIRVIGGSFIDDGVTLTAPDYVFEPNYTLMPIDELAKFVREQKHLPNVPKATDIRSQGLNLSQFQMRLLEKVEELTLYTVAQHEQNQKLQERLTALEAQLAQKQ